MGYELVRAREPRTGPATAATHRGIWAVCAATVAWGALTVSEAGHPVLAAFAVGLLTMLPRGPLLGAALTGVLVALAVPMLGVFAGAVAAVGVALIALPAQHLPRWLGPLSPAALAASAVVGGAYRALPGALAAVVLAALLAGTVRRLTRRHLPVDQGSLGPVERSKPARIP